MRELISALYWATVGAVVVPGLYLNVGGEPPMSWLLGSLLIFVAMVAFGAKVLGRTGIWAFLVGLGGSPALIILANVLPDFLVSDPSCQKVSWGNSSGGFVTGSPNEDAVICAPIPGSYVILVAIFSAIALSGVVWKFLRYRPRAAHPP